MGETLGIAHNVFEKVAREKDREERLKQYEEWQKDHAKRKQQLTEMQAKLKQVEKQGSEPQMIVEDNSDTGGAETNSNCITNDEAKTSRSKQDDECKCRCIIV